MKKIFNRLLPLLVLGVAFLVTLQPAAAAFNSNNLIDDMTFDNVNTMNAAQIDSWLNAYFPNSCISSNSGFAAIDPIGYNPSQGYIYGDYVTAGKVIADAAQAYDINPQVLITTLQKEQSLVAGGVNYCENGDAHKYAAAVGYGCPDGGTRYNYTGLSLYRRNGTVVSSVGPTCVNAASKAGFSQQVIRAAWLLKFGEQRSKGNTTWAVIKGNWDNSDDPYACYGGPMTTGNYKRCNGDTNTVFYDGYTTIDGTATHMDSGATAALYWYTPHFNGNQSFDSIFNQYFGSQYANDTFSPHPNGTLVYDANGIYLIDSGQRRFFTFPQIIDSYHYNWNRIKLASTGDENLPAGPNVDTLAAGTVFRVDNDPTVTYVMDYDSDNALKKRVITDQVFKDLGYSNKDVMTVPSYVVPSATFSTPLTVAQHPSGTIIILYGIPKVWVIDHGTKRWVQNELSFDTNRFRQSDLKGGTQMDSWLTEGTPLQPQIGTMVLANGGIGLIDSDANGLMVRPVGPWECYSNRLHYTSSDWINDYKTQYLPTRTGNLFTC